MAALPQDEETLSDLLLYWEEEFEKGNCIAAKQLCEKHPHLLEKAEKGILALKASVWSQNPENSASSQHEFYQYLQMQTVLKDRFRIEEILGQGGQGIVYKALDLKLERHVAIKSSKRLSNIQESEKLQLLEEAKRIASLKHPGIVTVFDILEFQDTFLLVSEFVEGGDLGKALARNHLSFIQKLNILKDVANALDYAHSVGIIHYDLKPSNILLDSNLKAKVCDFGISLRNPTISGQEHLGSLAYASPEQIQGATLDSSTDIWSLGVVAFQTITGKLPFEPDTPDRTIETILNGEPPSIRSINRDAPRHLETLLVECLQKSSQNRISSAKLVSEKLSTICEGLKKNNARRRLALTGFGFLVFLMSVMFASWLILPIKPISEMDKIRSKKPLDLTPENIHLLNNQLNSFTAWHCPKQEIWQQKEDGTFIADGSGNLTFKQPLTDGFTIQFDLKVLSGLRARFILNWNSKENSKNKFLHLGNEGFTRKFGLYGSGKKASMENLLDYDLNQTLHCTLTVSNGQYKATVNEQVISEGSYKRPEGKSLILSISSGDSFSPGTVEFKKFRLTDLSGK